MQILRDLRLAFRLLRREWRFALAFVLPLALGLGAGATFFSIIDHVLYRPPPGVRDPGSIVRIGIATSRFPDPFIAGNLSTSWLDIQALTQHATTLSAVAGFIAFRPSLGRGENARTIPVILATASYFDVLGVRPQLGRFYTKEEDQATSPVVPCVAGDRFWRQELGGDAAALGRQLEVGRVRCTVVGVAPADFNGTGFAATDLWLPLRASAEASHGGARLWTTDNSHWIRLIARARPGMRRADIDLDVTRAYRSVSGRGRDPRLENTMKSDALLGGATATSQLRIRTARWLLGGACALLLLVGANLVNLLIARALGRIRETAIRIALGGSRARILGQQLLECVILALLAGGGALVVVRWAGPFARLVLFPGTTFADGPVTSRTVAAASAIALLVGSAVAIVTSVIASRVDPAVLLNAAGTARSTSTRRAHRGRLVLVGVQAAVSMALLVASAAFVRSFRGAAGAELGFEMEGLIYADVPGVTAVIPDPGERRAFYAELHQRIRSMPGVTGASLATAAPWFNNRAVPLSEPGRDSLPRVRGLGDAALDVVTPDYRATMGIALREGRWIDDADVAGAPPVMVVSASMATLYWGSERAALGKHVRVGDSTGSTFEVVGVARDIRFMGTLDAPPTPSYWIPFAQSGELGSSGQLFVRARGDAEALIPTLRRVVQGARPGLPAADVHLMKTHMDPLLASWRLGATAFTALGALAALIAMLGLFSVLAYSVAERRRELAIRNALGARRSQIVVPVVRQGIAVVAAGAAIGILVCTRAAQWIEPQLFHVRLLDPLVVAAVAASLLVAAGLAVAGPARRAASLDPMEVLRAE